MARESYIIVVICLADLFSTIWLITTGRAVEGNPVMSYYLNMGWAILIVMKVMLFVLPIFVLEWCRRYRTSFVRSMLRFAIAAYVGLYALVFIHTNVLASYRADEETCPTVEAHQRFGKQTATSASNRAGIPRMSD